MYRLMSGDTLVGVFQKVVFVRKNIDTNTNIECSKGEAEAIVAGGVTYSISNSEAYADCAQVAVFELDSEVERTAELDYMRVMANLI